MVKYNKEREHCITYTQLKKFIVLSETWEARNGLASSYHRGIGKCITNVRARIKDKTASRGMVSTAIDMIEKVFVV